MLTVCYSRNGLNRPAYPLENLAVFLTDPPVRPNRLEDQELSVLALHLLQICLVYVNTLMIQQILMRPDWRSRMKQEDYRALSPLIYNHINPYGIFELDMDQRLPIEYAVA